MTILITGGSGNLAGHLRRNALAAGHRVRLASRSPRTATGNAREEWVQADAATGEGLDSALAGVDAVIHCASAPVAGKHDVDVEGTRRLIEAGVGHFIYPSIVGIDEIPFKYYRRKLEAEQIIEAGNVPYTILRATQFHEFIGRIIGAAMRVPLAAPLPAHWPLQSVASSEVAAELVRCLGRGPGGRRPNFGGPEIRSFGAYANSWMEKQGIRKRLVRLRLPGMTAAGFAAGKHTDTNAREGRITWAEWLEQEHPAARQAVG